jgi:hypothetical protein
LLSNIAQSRIHALFAFFRSGVRGIARRIATQGHPRLQSAPQDDKFAFSCFLGNVSNIDQQRAASCGMLIALPLCFLQLSVS